MLLTSHHCSLTTRTKTKPEFGWLSPRTTDVSVFDAFVVNLKKNQPVSVFFLMSFYSLLSKQTCCMKLRWPVGANTLQIQRSDARRKSCRFTHSWSAPASRGQQRVFNQETDKGERNQNRGTWEICATWAHVKLNQGTYNVRIFTLSLNLQHNHYKNIFLSW